MVYCPRVIEPQCLVCFPIRTQHASPTCPSPVDYAGSDQLVEGRPTQREVPYVISALLHFIFRYSLRCPHRHIQKLRLIHVPNPLHCLSQYQFTHARARQCSRHSGQGFIWTTQGYWFDSCQEQRIRIFSKTTRTDLGFTQPHI